jgi:ethanolamine utilization protein EutQ (cupin superfamily)
MKTENTSITTEQESTEVRPNAPEMKWTELRGKVQRVDLTQNTVQIKEKGTNKLIEVSVNEQIKVMDSSNHALALGDLKEGQKVVIRNESRS